MSGYGSIVRRLPILATVLLFAVGVGLARTSRPSSGTVARSVAFVPERSIPALRFRLRRRFGALSDPELPHGWEYGLHGRWALFRRVDGDRSHVTIKPATGGWHVRYFDDEGRIERGTLTDAPVGFERAVAIATERVREMDA